MPAPDIVFTVTGNKISSVSGYDNISVSFYSDIPYIQCEVRATKASDSWGRGQGRLVAAFSSTPSNTTRTFEVYDTDLISGEGDYRISIYAQSEDGGWNDNWAFIPNESSSLITNDNKNFLSMR